MASEGATTGQPHLHKQDLQKLDVSKLTALSPEVISRQATINIGTIGHVAHGKSTVVKAISGVQTVRFKNELERNITIKLGGEEEEDEEEEESEEEEGSEEAEEPERVMKVRPSTKNNLLLPSVLLEGLPSHAKEPLPSLSTRVSHKQTAIVRTNSRGRKRKRLGSKKKRARGNRKASQNHNDDEAQESHGEWEVERILDHQKMNGEQCFLVKWKDWEPIYNSWEPMRNLQSCQELIVEYFQRNRSAEFHARLKGELTKEELREKAWKIVDVNSETLEEFMESVRVDGKLKFTEPSEEEVDMKVKSVKNVEVASQEKADARRAILAQALARQRKQQMLQLADWQNEMNVLTPHEAIIKVENECDLEIAPQNFNYITTYIPGAGVEIPDDPYLYCSCTSCTPRSSCRKNHDTSDFAYDRNGHLRLTPGSPIFECNKNCKCDKKCMNRVVQNGRQVELCIYRTSNGCGWGVKALQNIKKGTFVCQYVGEVITTDEAEDRGEKYDAEGNTYLFDLDFNNHENCKYTVDAATFGNISHFINHSCDPNCVVYSVWINCLDPDLPCLCLFAYRDIQNQEQVTFDYMHQLNKTRMSKSLVLDQNDSFHDGAKTECKCGAQKCRKYLF